MTVAARVVDLPAGPARGRAAEIAAIHDGFLARVADLVERLAWVARTAEPARRRARQAARLPDQLREARWAMGCHERYEEASLFPALAAHAGLDPAPLVAGHAALHERAERCVAALEALAAGFAADGDHGDGAPDPAALAAARAALEGYQAALAAHLAEEEALVFPRLAALPADADADADATLPTSCAT